MDLSYENNKGLHAFFLSLVMILGLFTIFAPVDTYAADYGTGHPSGDFKVVKFNQKIFRFEPESQYETQYRLNTPINSLVMYDTPEKYYDKISSAKVIDKSTGKDLSSYVVLKDYYYNGSKGKQIFLNKFVSLPQGTEIEITWIMSEVLPKSAYGYNIYDSWNQEYWGQASFSKTVPPQPAVIQAKEVQELPTVLGKVAGIVTLAGCLIFAVLLGAGSVRRLISSFLR